MARRLLVEAGPFETRLALIEGGDPVEFRLWPAGHQSRVGELRAGRINATEAALGAYFIDIGLDRPAFLKRKDAPGATEGSLLVVEVLRDAAEGKAARVSARTPDAREATVATKAPALLREAPHPAARLARERAVDTIRLAGTGASLAGFRIAMAEAAPTATLEIGHGVTDLFVAEGIADAFDACLAPTLALDSGVRLTIDETEALTAIDIDGGALSPRRANEAGAGLAARAIRLRNLSGQIVIDFTGDAAAIAAGRAVLARALASDPSRPELAKGDLNGLVLVTRQRVGDSVTRATTVPCPVASGRWVSPGHLAARLCRRIEAAAQARPGRPLRALVPDDVARYLEGTGAEAFAALRLSLGATLRLEQTPAPLPRDVTVTVES